MYLDGEVGLDRPLVTHLLSDPAPVRNVRETPDELVAGEFGCHAGILGLRRSRERRPRLFVLGSLGAGLAQALALLGTAAGYSAGLVLLGNEAGFWHMSATKATVYWFSGDERFPAVLSGQREERPQVPARPKPARLCGFRLANGFSSLACLSA